jgi:hypothetical protein
MRLRILLAFVAIATTLSCQSKKDDPEILKKILTDYFDGIKNQNLEKLNALTTSDFVLFENGKIWTNDSLVTISEEYTSFNGEWTFDNMKVTIDESSGYIVYYNHGEFIYNDTIKRQVDWLESAAFRKINGEWKMNFLHSTVRR